MTHHFDPEFSGYRPCNCCGDTFHIDDLSTDLLCEDCNTVTCGRCEYLYKKSETVTDHKYGLLCEECAKEVSQEREDKFVNNMQLHPLFQEIFEVHMIH